MKILVIKYNKNINEFIYLCYLQNVLIKKYKFLYIIKGIIPRSITDIFNYIKEEQEENSDAVFSLKMTFLCIFQEEFIDLLAENRPKSSMRARSPNPSALRTPQSSSSSILVRDLGKKGIILTGLKEEKILSVDMLLE